MSQEMTKEQLLMKKSIRRASRKQRFVGGMYFLGTLLMAICVFFPLLKDVAYVKTGRLSITTFWFPIPDVFSLKFSVLALGMNFYISLLYMFTVGFCIANLIYALAKLDALYIKGNKKIGYNQNAIAMNKLGRAFSRTFSMLMYYMYFTHMFLGAKPTVLFYVLCVMFLFVHYVGGFIGMGASRFTVKDGVQELPRQKGRFAPIFRNTLQFVFIGALMYFMSKANVINNFLLFFDKYQWAMYGSFKANFGTIVANCFTPLLQHTICYFMLVLVVHATGTREWSDKGTRGFGMRTTFIFAGLTAAFAIAFNLIRLYLVAAHQSSAISMQMVYVTVIALALCLIELAMAKLPRDKKKVKKAEAVEELLDDTDKESQEGLKKVEVLPNNYKYVDAPAVYTQPDGTQLLVLPLEEEVVEDTEELDEEVEAVEVEEEQDDRVFATPVCANALAREEYKKAMKARWLARAQGMPGEIEEETRTYKKPSDEDDEIILGDDKKVKCPHCGNIVWAKEGAPAYICPECKEKFSF